MVDCAEEAEVRSAVVRLCTARLRLPEPDSLPSPPSTVSLVHSLQALLSYHLHLTDADQVSPDSASASAAALSFLRRLSVGVEVAVGEEAQSSEAVMDLIRGLRVLSLREMKSIQERLTEQLHSAQLEGRKRRMGGSGAASEGGRVDMSRGQVGR